LNHCYLFLLRWFMFTEGPDRSPPFSMFF